MRDFHSAVLYRLLQLLAWLLLRLGFGLTVHGQQHIPKRGAFILASNHLSYMDPVVLGAACPRRLVFLARADLFEVPWLGAFMRILRTIPVQRSDPDLGLRDAVRLLRRGQAVAIFPEGGRQFSGVVGSARPGVGLLAAGAKAPVLPVLLTGTFKALPPSARMIRPAKIRVAFGPQIRYATARLAEEDYQAIAEQVTAGWQSLLRAVFKTSDDTAKTRKSAKAQRISSRCLCGFAALLRFRGGKGVLK